MTHHTSSPSVLQQVASLSRLPLLEIRALWRQYFKTDTPTHNRPFLERRLAYKIQEAELSRNNLPLLERNARRIAQLIKTGKMAARYTNAQAPAGTLFERESGALSAEHVLNVLARLTAGTLPASVETSLQLKMAPVANTQRYDSLRSPDEVSVDAAADAKEINHV